MDKSGLGVRYFPIFHLSVCKDAPQAQCASHCLTDADFINTLSGSPSGLALTLKLVPDYIACARTHADKVHNHLLRVRANRLFEDA